MTKKALMDFTIIEYEFYLQNDSNIDLETRNYCILLLRYYFDSLVGDTTSVSC